MDIKFENSDIKLTQSGEYSYVRGIDEAEESLKRIVSIPKGSFTYDKNLGTDIRRLDRKSSVYLKELITLINEALISLTDTSAKIVGVNEGDNGSFIVGLEVSYKNESKNTEVIVDADL